MTNTLERTIVGLDVGTTKICAIIGEGGRDGAVRVLGIGIEPARGLSKGVVVNLDEAAASIAIAIEKAERLSGCKIGSAYVGVTGEHISSLNSRGVVPIGRSGGDISVDDVRRAVEAAKAVAVPSQREVIHVIPRTFIVDGQSGVLDPVGMAGVRLEVETHIVTGAATSLQNLARCVRRAGVEIDEMVLEPLACGEAVLTPAERRLGVALVDIGGGTTDLAIFIDGSIWHTAVLPVGGNHLSNDLSIVLRVPFEAAEELKLHYGRPSLNQRYGKLAVRANEQEADEADEEIPVTSFNGQTELVSRHLLNRVIQARIEDVFDRLGKEIRRSGYAGMLPAGVVLTGGCAMLPGIAELARQVIGLPVRVGQPQRLLDGTAALSRPDHATGVGLLLWGFRNGEPLAHPAAQRSKGLPRNDMTQKVKNWLREFVP